MKRKTPKPERKRVRYDEVPLPKPSVLREDTPLTMLELRQNAAGIIEGLRRGVHYRLTYRGKTVGVITPAQPDAGEIPPDDPIFHLEDYASNGPAGHLTNEEIDQVVYGY